MEYGATDRFYQPQTAREAAHAALLPPFDELDALERMGGEMEILVIIAGTLRDSQGELFASIEAALALGDFEAAGRHAHSMKGALLALSATPGATLAGAIETAVRNATPAPYAQWLEMLRLELGRLEWALAELCDRESSALT